MSGVNRNVNIIMQVSTLIVPLPWLLLFIVVRFGGEGGGVYLFCDLMIRKGQLLNLGNGL